MKTIIILTCIMFVSTNIIKKQEEKCEGIHINGEIHRKEIMAKGLNRPYQLSCFHLREVIFFSCNIGKDSEDTFQIAFIDKEQRRPKVISSLENGFATAVNNEKQEAYLGDTEGVHLYPLNLTVIMHNIGNGISNGLSQNLVVNHNIWYLFHKQDTLYFITYPKLRLHKRYSEKGEAFIEEVDEIPEKIYQFVIDGEDDTFFTNKTGLYMIEKGLSGHRYRIHGNYTSFRAAAISNKGHAHFAGGNAIYLVNKHKKELEEIAEVKNVFGLTFDKDNNIIYSNSHQIVKLLPGCKKDL